MNTPLINKALILRKLKSLYKDIISIERISKSHSNSSNNFVLYLPGNQRKFVKINTPDRIRRYISGSTLLRKYISVVTTQSPIIPINKKYAAIIQDFKEGVLMAELFNSKFSNSDIVNIEKRKEKQLEKLHAQCSTPIPIKYFIDSPTQDLFIKRVSGSMFKDFYTDRKPILNILSKNLYINGELIPIKPIEILLATRKKIMDLITNKYPKYVDVITSHNDLHHGNIIFNPDTREIDFIDYEYASQSSTHSIALSKAYYNDVIGVMFFHGQDQLRKYFDWNYKIKDHSVYVTIKNVCFPKIRFDITDIKLRSRYKHISKSEFATEPFSLKDCLLICHLFTKNPNLYPKDIQIIFTCFIYFIDQMNVLKPSTILSKLSKKQKKNK